MPRPAPRVAPATTATRPVSGFLPATGRVRDLAASGDCLGPPAIAIPPDADHRRINRWVSTGVWSVRKGLRRSVALCRLERLHFSGRVTGYRETDHHRTLQWNERIPRRRGGGESEGFDAPGEASGPGLLGGKRRAPAGEDLRALIDALESFVGFGDRYK